MSGYFLEPFLLLQFGFVIFWCKNIGNKAARRMLTKLTTAQSYQKIRAKGVDVNLMTFLRGILTPSQFREINEKCFTERTKLLY